MSLSPLTPVTDYQSMLNRIFWFTTAAALAGVWMLRLYIPPLEALLKQIDFTVAFGDDKILPIPGGYLLPALAVGMTTRIYRLHARISDVLALRECFDVDVIIAEFGTQLGIDLTTIPEHELLAHRHQIMRRAFYPFVTGPQPAIDHGLVLRVDDGLHSRPAGRQGAVKMRVGVVRVQDVDLILDQHFSQFWNRFALADPGHADRPDMVARRSQLFRGRPECRHRCEPDFKLRRIMKPGEVDQQPLQPARAQRHAQMADSQLLSR